MGMMGLLFIGQTAAKANQGKVDADQRAKERRDRVLHGLGKQGSLSEEDRHLLADIQRQLSAGHLQTSTRCCPQCHQNFALVTMHQVTVDYCTRCRGYWFDPGELGTVTGTAHDIRAIAASHRKGKYCCPICDTAMWESIYCKPFNLLVDRCPDGHGIYLEQGELERALKMT